MTDALVTKLSEKYDKTPGAVLLSWLVQRGNWSVVPKSANPERMKANLDVSPCRSFCCRVVSSLRLILHL